MKHLYGIFGILVLAVLLAGAGVQAQDDGIVAEGLLSPRHITYAEDGSLWIAEAGQGGDVDMTGPFGPSRAGLTGQISVVQPDGAVEVVMSELPSMDWGFNEIVGVHAVLPVGNSLWLVVGNGGGEELGSLTRGIVELNAETLEPLRSLDALAAETALNPDQEIIDSNPVDIAAAEDGTLYVADAGANTVWTLRAGGPELEVFATWTEGNPVPTSIEIGPDGDIYVGFLSSFPHAEGSSRIERYGPDGVLKETLEGYTAVVDLAFGEDSLYAVQFGRFGEAGFAPNTGRIVEVTADGPVPVLENVNYPFGLTLSPDGVLMVAFDTHFGDAPGAGRVGSVEAVAVTEPLAPVATPEVEPVATPEVTG